MDIFIPDNLRVQLREFGEEGARWLDGLPERVAELERDWGFRTGPAFDHGGAVSWVAPVEREDGCSAAVLKVGYPHDEARFEAEALRFLEGRRAVHLLRASEDGFALLLERCLPGTNLWTLSEDEADAVACRILPDVWRTPAAEAPFDLLTDIVAHWWEGLPAKIAMRGYDAEMVAQAVERGQALAASQPQCVLLHGDFHPGNVLAAEREPWLIIDPKPLVGEPAYDLAQWLHNRCGAARASSDPVAVLRGQIQRFADTLGLAPARIAGWAFVKAVGWESEAEVVTLFQKVVEAW